MLQKIKTSSQKIYIALFYRNDTKLLTLPGKKDRDWFIIQALIGTVFALFTGATYLTGLFNKVNAPEILIGYLPIIGSIAGIVTIFAGYTMQRIRSRKKFILICNTILKTLIVLIAWIPLIFPNQNAAYIMIIMALVAYALNNFMAIAINSWFVDLIDSKIRGQYMSVRNMVALIANLIVPVIVSAFIDTSSDQYLAIVVVFTIAWIIMWAESYSFYKIGEPPMSPATKKIKLKDVFIVPIKNKEFMKFMVPIAAFYFIWYIAMSYGTLYQLNYLGLSYTFISLASVLNVILQFIWYPIIGKLVDRYNTDLLLMACFMLYFIDSLIWGFTNLSSKYLMIILVNVIASMTAPFFSLTLFKKKYDIIPQTERSLYDGFYTAIIASIIALAPIIGSLLKDYIAVNIKPFWIFEVPQFQLIFMVTNILLLVLILFNLKKTIRLYKEAKSQGPVDTDN
ncbi:MAG: MFS transporter [Clostridiaceae bacterium]|nr:MFS transporter [Clostridiaceae bacterium]